MNPVTPPKRVLIIEDETEISEILSQYLREAGFDPFCATGTARGMEVMKERGADAIVLDINLEGENGLDFLPDFKQLYPQVPVMILTGTGYDNPTIETALQHGASAYFSKESGLENVAPMLERLTRG
jgi:DNA-binding response OmpR family regulator